MQYYGNVFRPPSEARSLIIQVTLGCAHNDCTFCYMYKDAPFVIRKVEDIKKDLREVSSYSPFIERIFLADGDALVVKTQELLEILEAIKTYYPHVERVSAYATAQDINRKSIEELQSLYDNGLKMLYIGFETGDEEILKDIKKGVTYEEYVSAMEKCRQVGFLTSITIIAGLGGKEKWRQNALGTAKLISATKPDYVSYLTMRIYRNTPLYEDYKTGKFQMPEPGDILREMKLFLEHVDSQGTVFRSNHASNYLLLAGTLNEDREDMIAAIDRTIQKQSYRPDVLRGF